MSGGLELHGIGRRRACSAPGERATNRAPGAAHVRAWPGSARRWVAAGILVSMLSGLTRAAEGTGQSVQQRFDTAQARFEQARTRLEETGDGGLEARRLFHESAEQFAALAEEGIRSANLYVNAGNSFHFAGDEPRALLWYLRAETLANTPEVRSGLATLRRLCRAAVWAPPKPSIGRVLMFWHYDLSHRLKQWVLLSTYPIGCACAIVSVLTRSRRRWLQAGVALMLVGGALGVSDAVATGLPGEAWAVTIQPAKGYAGDGSLYSIVVDALVPGQEVRILESRQDWAQVELPGGTRCWLPAGSFEPVALGTTHPVRP